jgi:hypothetical protein
VKFRFVSVMLACLALSCRLGYADSGAGFSLRRASARHVPALKGKVTPPVRAGLSGRRIGSVTAAMTILPERRRRPAVYVLYRLSLDPLRRP